MGSGGEWGQWQRLIPHHSCLLHPKCFMYGFHGSTSNDDVTGHRWLEKFLRSCTLWQEREGLISQSLAKRECSKLWAHYRAPQSLEDLWKVPWVIFIGHKEAGLVLGELTAIPARSWGQKRTSVFVIPSSCPRKNCTCLHWWSKSLTTGSLEGNLWSASAPLTTWTAFAVIHMREKRILYHN